MSSQPVPATRTVAPSKPHALRSAGARLRAWTTTVAVRVDRPLLILLLIGVVLRILTMILYFPTALQWIDAVRFSRIGQWHGLFSDYYMPAGYAAFLKVTHFISSDVAVTTGVQHVLGLAEGSLVYLAVRRGGVPPWLAVVPAAVPVLGGDQLYLEHLLMNDFLFSVTVVAGLCVAMYALAPSPRWRLLVVASALLAGSGLVRQSGLVLPLVLGLCAFIAGRVSVRRRMLHLAAAVIPAIVVILVYVGIADLGGRYTGLTDMGGWNLYARVAPFADCHDFTPPRGTAVLCESSAPQTRAGPLWYAWDSQSQGQRELGLPTPANARLPGQFAEAAIEHQPLDYLAAVFKDMTRYADPDGGTARPWSGQLPATVSFEQGLVDPGTAHHLEQVMGGYWTDLTPRLRGVHLLYAYQGATRIVGALWWILLALALLGMFVARGAARTGSLLFGLSALALYLIPTMTVTWDWRYGIPPQVELAAAAALGAWGVWTRLRYRSGASLGEPSGLR